MRYAIFSDIHGNFQAWEAVLADMRASGAEVLVCLGDVVGYGPRPQDVLDAICAETQNLVVGNHDAAAAGRLDLSCFNPDAREIIRWTRKRLSKKSLKALKDVPLAIEENDLYFVHAEVSDPGRFGYIETAEEAKANLEAGTHRVTFIGHTHHPVIFEMEDDGSVARLPPEDTELDPGRRYIVNVGSVGEPRNPEDIHARYVLYDSDSAQLFFRSAEFDAEAYRMDLEQSGLKIKPYFLKVIDHEKEALEMAKNAEAARALMMDMVAPIRAPSGLDVVTAQLILPGAAPRKSHMSALMAAASIALLVAVIFLVVVWDPEGKGDEVPDLLANSWKGDPDNTSGTPDPDTPPAAPDTATDPEPVKPTDPQPGSGPVAPEKPPANPDNGGAADDPNKVTAVAGSDPPPPSPPPSLETANLVLDPAMTKPSDPAPTGVTPNTEPPKPPPGPQTRTVAHWRLDKSDILVSKGFQLQMREAGEVVAPLVPAVPLTGEENTAAIKGGVWEEVEPANTFAMARGRSFTLEFWFSTVHPGAGLKFLAGTLVNSKDDGRGWMLALRGESNRAINLEFDPGPGTPIVLRIPDDGFFDDRPHHLALVWDHAGGQGPQGKVSLYVDGKQRGEKEIPHDQIPEHGTGKPFCLGNRPDHRQRRVNRFEGVLDEVRFSEQALKPEEFLMAGNRDAVAAAAQHRVIPKIVLPPPEFPESLGNGLLFYGPFEEPLGSKATLDRSGNGLHLRTDHPIIETVGLARSAFEFGRDENPLKLLSQKNPFPQLRQLAVSAWYRLPADRVEGRRRILALENIELSASHSGLVANLDGAGEVLQVPAPADTEWHHVVAQNDGQTTTLYLDGEVVGNPLAEPIPDLNQWDLPLAIGSLATGAGEWFKGEIDEVAIWDRVLSPDEIRQLRDAGLRDEWFLKYPEVAGYWRMENGRAAEGLVDSLGQRHLTRVYPGSAVAGLSPDPVPWSGEPNRSANRFGVFGEREISGEFQLRPDQGFTFEGWISCVRPIERAFVAGTRSGAAAGSQGWQIDVRPPKDRTGDRSRGQIAFIYDTGPGGIQAVAEDVVIFDEEPHHFACVWYPRSVDDEETGIMLLYLDGQQVASAALPRAQIPEQQANRFVIGNRKGTGRLALDELRFTKAPLRPGLFLMAGVEDSEQN